MEEKMSKNIVLTIALIVVLFVFGGCSHNIKYVVDNNSIYLAAKPQAYSLASVIFKDISAEQTFTKCAVVQNAYENKDMIFRYNSPDKYAGKEVALGISKMIAEHLQAAGLFSGADNEICLSGDIAKFEAFCEVNMAGEKAVNTAGIWFGAIGAGIAASSHKNEEIERWGSIELVNIKLTRKSDNQIVWQGSVKVNEKEKVKWLNDQGPYVLADNLLKEAVNQLTEKIEKELKLEKENK